jgi:CelD/BcsL family acetyltransferase involved in cellulose biosynthesis
MSRPFLKAVEANLLHGDERLVLVGATSPHGLPAAVFPFVRRRRLGATVIEGLDFGIADYFAPCLAPDVRLEPGQAKLLWADVLRVLPQADAVTFKKMPRLLYGAPHALSDADFVLPMAACATTLALRRADDDAEKNEPVSLAREVRRKSKKLEKFGPVAFAQASGPEEIDAALAALIGFRRARFAEMRRRDVLMYDEIVAFYRELALGRDGHPVGRIFTLRAGEKLVAIVYGMAWQDVFTLIIPAMSPDHEAQAGSPGLVALFRALEWCRKEGYRFFDLSVGSLHYKTRFEADTVELYEYQKALTMRGRIVVADAALRRKGRHAAIKWPWIRDLADSLGRLRMRVRARLALH